jgi:putative cell wall-binding protein
VAFNIVAPSYAELSGATRIETAIAAAQAAYPSGAETVVLAYSGNFPDALSATALAGMLDAPILLSGSDTLSPQTEAALSGLGTKNVVMVGGTSVLSQDVHGRLGTLLGSANVTRLSGDDRFATNLDIYAYGKDHGRWGRVAVIANGANFPDALSISPYAAQGWNPLFLTTQSGALGEDTLSALTAGDFDQVVIVGGTSVVPSSTEEALAASFKAENVTRLAGADRYATSDAIARWLVASHGFSWNGACIASGATFPDSLTGSVLAARQMAPMLLASAGNQTTINSLLENKATVGRVHFLGGVNAVPQSIRDTVLSQLGLR